MGLGQVEGGLAVGTDSDDFFGRVIGPHPLKPVKFSHFRPKQMHDDFIRVNQHPVSLAQAL